MVSIVDRAHPHTMVIMVWTKCLKMLDFWTRKMKMLRKNKPSNCKNENVWYPQEHLATWLSVYSVNNSYSLQYSPYIWNWTKTRKCKNCQLVHWILVVTGSSSYCCTQHSLIFVRYQETGRKNVQKLNRSWTTNIWIKMVLRTCFDYMNVGTGSNSCCCIIYLQLFLLHTQHSLISER